MVEEKKQDPENKRPPKKSTGRRVASVLGWLFVIGLTGVLFVGGAVFGYITSIVKDEPVRSRALIEEKMSDNAITGFAFFGDGSPIGQLRTEEDRRPIKHSEIPQIVIDAVISIEDNRFETHEGVDYMGTARAIKQRLLNEPVQTGGSTLTQQLARQVFLSRDKTANRKVKEILLAFRLERFLSKPEILTAYLNKVPFGNGSNGYNVYGIKAAARGIFNINDLNKLNIAQAAYLAGLPQLPSAYSAFNGVGDFDEKNFNRAMKRQALVLTRMLEEGKITQQQYNEAKAFDIKKSLAKKSQKAYATYPYLMMEVERQASKIIMDLNNPEISEDDSIKELMKEARTELSTGGYRVYTTIDKTIYHTMRKIAEDDSNFFPDDKVKGKEQTAAMMIDNKTGAILSMIEGRDFNYEQMNYATQMMRQPGSAIKPIADYLPALEAGKVQPASIVDDSPIILKDGGNGFHIPRNVDNKYDGLMTARLALNDSKNTIALKLFNEAVGIENALKFSQKLGISSFHKGDFASGTAGIGGLTDGVYVEELTNAYSSIGNDGKFTDAYMISKIVDADGKIVYKHEVDPVQVYSPQTAYLMADMMRTVITNGSGYIVRDHYKHFKKVPIVGKTGSSQDYADSWFMGLSPDVTLGVWVGYKSPQHKLAGARTYANSQRAHSQKIWAKIMNESISLKPELFKSKEFKRPDGIVSKTVSAHSGKLPSELTNKFVTDLFNAKYVPTELDDSLAKAKYISYRGANYIPHEATPEDMLKEQVVIKREKPIDVLIQELEAAFKVMKKHEPLSYYIPKDANKDMPTKVDPRVDDGRNPTPPGSLNYSQANGKAVISFTPSGSPDVVGYRLFRSVAGGPFVHDGAVVLTDDTKQFTVSSGALVSYYIVAVDVAGKTSDPSVTVGAASTPEFPSGPGDGVGIPIDPPSPTEPGTGETPGEEPGGPAGLPQQPGQPQAQEMPNGVRLTWSPNPAEDRVIQYFIYFSPNNDGAFEVVGSSHNQQFLFKKNGPFSGTFRIIAVNDLGESPASPTVFFNKE